MEPKVANTKKSMTGLGRGLGALLSDSGSEKGAEKSFETPVPRRMEAMSSMHEIMIESVETNPFQPRTHFDQEALQELADSRKYLRISARPTTNKCSKWLSSKTFSVKT